MTPPPDVAQWAWDEAQPTDAIINGMCMTWRHDFGLNAPEADADGLGMGMTQAERDGLRMQMRQIWMHDIAPNYARALMAAHARGAGEERERCAGIADENAEQCERAFTGLRALNAASYMHGRSKWCAASIRNGGPGR